MSKKNNWNVNSDTIREFIKNNIKPLAKDAIGSSRKIVGIHREVGPKNELKSNDNVYDILAFGKVLREAKKGKTKIGKIIGEYNAAKNKYLNLQSGEEGIIKIKIISEEGKDRLHTEFVKPTTKKEEAIKETKKIPTAFSIGDPVKKLFQISI